MDELKSKLRVLRQVQRQRQVSAARADLGVGPRGQDLKKEFCVKEELSRELQNEDAQQPQLPRGVSNTPKTKCYIIVT